MCKGVNNPRQMDADFCPSGPWSRILFCYKHNRQRIKKTKHFYHCTFYQDFKGLCFQGLDSSIHTAPSSMTVYTATSSMLMQATLQLLFKG